MLGDQGGMSSQTLSSLFCSGVSLQMKISVLASSSRGNASVIRSGGTTVMVDAGISARRICNGLAECGLDFSQVQGIFITHEHTDHVCGLGTLNNKYELTIYCSRYLRNDLRAVAPNATLKYIEPGEKVKVGELEVTPISVSHDAVDPLGYVFEAAGVRLGYVTDTGQSTRAMLAALEGVHALYLESNYDEDMLHNSGRPYSLIERIEGIAGHLSNDQAGVVVRDLAHSGLRHVILAHISPECNTPDCARKAMQGVLDEVAPNVQLHVARQFERLPWIEL